MSFFDSSMPTLLMEGEADSNSSTFIEGQSADFKADFDRRSFSFAHRLAHHPLFDLSRLALAAEKVLSSSRPDLLHVSDATTTSLGTKFNEIPTRERASEAIRQIGQSGAWIKLTSINEVDAEYEALLAPLIARIEALIDLPLRNDIIWTGLTVFLSSPGIVTPYHIDHEPVFLFQIRGEKDYCIFPKNHPSLLSQDEIERYYAGEAEAADYREHLQNMGTTYRLRPGLAVHHPSLSPHWIRNADNVSVSIGIGFCLRSQGRQARIYQANRCLRYFGITPNPPGRSSLIDGLKSATVNLFSKRRPVGRHEVLFSGIDRMKAPIRFAKRLQGTS